jgi:flagellar basal body rod protein FlgG
LNRYTGSNPRRIEAPMLASGALEMSNVNAVDEMISMIRLQRAFEMAQKTVLSHEEMTQRLIQGVSSR